MRLVFVIHLCDDCGATLPDGVSSRWRYCEPCAQQRSLARGGECGTHPAYKRGCRCEKCRTANTNYHRALTSRRIGREPPTHGNAAYVNWGCRCEVCQDGHREAGRRFRESRRLAKVS